MGIFNLRDFEIKIQFDELDKVQKWDLVMFPFEGEFDVTEEEYKKIIEVLDLVKVDMKNKLSKVRRENKAKLKKAIDDLTKPKRKKKK